VYKFKDRVVEAILDLEKDYLVWPRGEYKRRLTVSIEQSFGFLNCLGFVDGTSFELMSKPAVNPFAVSLIDLKLYTIQVKSISNKSVQNVRFCC
jgi:hypothetical protein